MLPGASLPLIRLHWVIFESLFYKHLPSVVHWELLFYLLCLHCGCGRSRAEPACFQGAIVAASKSTQAKFKISNKFNMYSAGICFFFFFFLLSAKCSDSLSLGLSETTTRPNMEKLTERQRLKRKAKSRADADNLCSA